MVIHSKGPSLAILDHFLTHGIIYIYRDFHRTARTLLSSLNTSHPIITAELFEASLEDETPLTLAQELCTLPAHILALYSAIVHLYCQYEISGNGKALVVDDVLSAYDKLTDQLTRKGLALNRIAMWIQSFAAQGLLQLWHKQDVKPLPIISIPTLIDPACIIVICHSLEEIRTAFQLPEERSIDPWKRQARSLPGLVLPEKLRRAVLQPMQPLLYTMQPGGQGLEKSGCTGFGVSTTR